MKLGVPIAGILLLCQAVPAGAGSFAVLTKSVKTETPSFVYFGEKQAQPPNAEKGLAASALPPLSYPQQPPDGLAGAERPKIHSISPSVIAYGSPDIEAMTVASTRPSRPRMRDPHLPVMVMRGGISGDALPSSSGQTAGPSAPAVAPTTSASEPTTKASTGRKPSQPPAPPSPAPAPPEAPPPPRPAATARIE